MTVLNVGNLMREHAIIGKYQFHVSKDAEKEFADRMHIFFEIKMPDICRIAAKHKRKTIRADDVIEFFNFKKNNYIGDEE